MTVSIVIPVFNDAAALRPRLSDILALPADEWVLVDDGSTDGTAELLAGLAQEHSALRVVTHETNRGRGAARNSGIQSASGDLIAFLDADTRPGAGWVEALVAPFEDPGVVAALSTLVPEGLDLSDPYHRYVASGKRGTGRLLADAPVPWRLLTTTATLFRRESFDRVGGFDDALNYGEDLELGLRLASHYPGGIVQSLKARAYQGGHARLSTQLEKFRAFGRDDVPRILARHPEAGPLLGLPFIPQWEGSSGWRAALGRVVLRGPIPSLARSTASWLQGPPARWAVRLLIGSAIASGYRAHIGAP